MDFYAKSDLKTTVTQHTKDLLNSEDMLFKLYPNLINQTDFNILTNAIKYHDLGKINKPFQQKMIDNYNYYVNNQGKPVYWEEGELAHPLLSVALVNEEYLASKYGLTKDEINLLEYLVAYHHFGRGFDVALEDKSHYKDEINALDNQALNFNWQDLGLDYIKPKRKRVRLDNNKYFGNSNYVKLLGLLNKIDYSASGHYAIEYPNNFLKTNLTSYFEANKLTKNSMQDYLCNHTNDNVVLVAQTGMGKTEGALNWIGDNKGFIILPLKSAINAQFQRIKSNYAFNKNQVGILHSSVDLNNINDIQLLESAKNLTLPLTVTTPDQLLKYVFKYPGYETTLATLSYSKLIVDELQQYDSQLLAYILYALKQAQDMGTKTLIMSATISPFIYNILDKLNYDYIRSDNYFMQDVNKRHKIQVIKNAINPMDILRGKGKSLVICNTVNKSKQIYDELKELTKDDDNYVVKLYNSKFIQQDRKLKEREIFADSKGVSQSNTILSDDNQSSLQQKQNNTPKTIIWVTTQVVEASLDIDFDNLYTELSDLTSFFQRLGRVYRRRNYQESNNQTLKESPFYQSISNDNSNEEYSLNYNVHVYVGRTINSWDISGISTKEVPLVYDKDLFYLSRKALLSKGNGYYTEQDKYALLEKWYSYARVKSTDYYQDILNNLDYLSNIKDKLFTKKEATKQFRAIDSVNVIPKSIYDDNIENINQKLGIKDNNSVRASSNNSHNQTINSNTNSDLRASKFKDDNLSDLSDFTVQISRKQFFKYQENIKPILKNEGTPYVKDSGYYVIDKPYSYDRGLEL